MGWLLASVLIASDVTGASGKSNRLLEEKAEALFIKGYLHYRAGQLVDAEDNFAAAYKLQSRQPVGAVSAYNSAFVCSLEGKIDESLAWLEKAFAAGYDNFAHVEEDGDLCAARNNPKYREIVDKARGRFKSTQAPLARHQMASFADRLVAAEKARDFNMTLALSSRLGWFAHERTIEDLNRLLQPKGFQLVPQDGTWSLVEQSTEKDH